MKWYLIIFGLIIFPVHFFGQDTKKHIIDEFTISANRSALQDDNSENRFGFGLGIYHAFLRDEKLDLITGIEFNHTNQLQKYVYQHHFSHWTDVNYTTNSISIPYGLRLNLYKNMKIFIESGGYIDLIVNSKQEGTFHYYPPMILREEYLRNMDLELQNTVGIYFGLGLKIPVYKRLMIIKANYKHGLIPLYSEPENIFNRYFSLHVGIKLN